MMNVAITISSYHFTILLLLAIPLMFVSSIFFLPKGSKAESALFLMLVPAFFLLALLCMFQMGDLSLLDPPTMNPEPNWNRAIREVFEENPKEAACLRTYAVRSAFRNARGYETDVTLQMTAELNAGRRKALQQQLQQRYLTFVAEPYEKVTFIWGMPHKGYLETFQLPLSRRGVILTENLSRKYYQLSLGGIIFLWSVYAVFSLLLLAVARKLNHLRKGMGARTVNALILLNLLLVLTVGLIWSLDYKLFYAWMNYNFGAMICGWLVLFLVGTLGARLRRLSQRTIPWTLLAVILCFYLQVALLWLNEF